MMFIPIDTVPESEEGMSLCREKFLNHVANVSNVHTLDLNSSTDSIEAAKKSVNDALGVCRAKPGELFSPAFLDAVKTIRTDAQC
jgi:hypothetical protein